MRPVLAVTAALALVIGALSVASARLGPSVDTLTTASSLDGIAVNTQVAVGFTTAMNIRSVESNFSLSPRVPGTFTSAGNTLLFTPRRNLAYSTTYTLTIGNAAHDVTGHHLFRAYHAVLHTQSEHFLFLGTHGADRGRLVLGSVSGKSRIIGPDDGSVTGFSSSQDGTLAVFARKGGPHERQDEIWLASLADGSTQLLLRRPDWTIEQPHLSPDGSTVAFLAENVRLCRPTYGCYRDNSTPVLELLDVHTRRVAPFRAASDTPITNFIAFSPTGQLAFTDLGSALTLASINGSSITHVPDRGNSLLFAGFDAQGDKVAFVGQTPSSTGGDILVYSHSRYLDISHGIYDASTPSFSSSGRAVAYAAYRSEAGIEPVYGINVDDLNQGHTRHVTNPRGASDWQPVWSPDDRYLAFVRSAPQEAMYMGSGRIWVVRPNGTGARRTPWMGQDITWVI
ncbi:MAG TPA: Ig-like domain-containing protein [Chloroflexota bacterium]|nr:Ig-like domain-containing protein [Chloroflexota bacterium]